MTHSLKKLVKNNIFSKIIQRWTLLREACALLKSIESELKDCSGLTRKTLADKVRILLSFITKLLIFKVSTLFSKSYNTAQQRS